MHLERHDYRIYYVNIDLRHQYGISVPESVPPGERSPAARSKEKRLYSQFKLLFLLMLTAFTSLVRVLKKLINWILLSNQPKYQLIFSKNRRVCDSRLFRHHNLILKLQNLPAPGYNFLGHNCIYSSQFAKFFPRNRS